MAQGELSLDKLFVLFSKFENETSDGQTITLTQLDKWLKQAEILGKKITTTDTGLAFFKFRKREIDFDSFCIFLNDLATTKQTTIDELKYKLENCGLPGASPNKPGEERETKK